MTKLTSTVPTISYTIAPNITDDVSDTHALTSRFRDSTTLAAFYLRSGGSNWKPSFRWDLNRPIHEWKGIILDPITNNVVGLNLSNAGLTGELLGVLGTMENLVTLVLNDNELSGSIPDSLGMLTKLEVLNIGDNEFTGSIPDKLSNLSSLKILHIYRNEGLTGGIPTTFNRLTKLSNLHIWQNENLGEEIPRFLTTLPELDTIDMHSNNMEGEIPSNWENQTQMSFIDISSNDLTGTIPASLGDLFQLKKLYLNNNQLDGCLPENLQKLCGQAEIRISANSLSLPNNFTDFCDSQIPSCERINSCRFQDSLTLRILYDSLDGPNWKRQWNWGEEPLEDFWGVELNDDGCVVWLDFDGIDNGTGDANEGGNGLSGQLPTAIGNLTALESISFIENNLIRGIPKSIGKLSRLDYFSIKNNCISGPIPEEIGQLTNLEVLNLDFNKISGRIPATLGKLTKLRTLRLHKNQLSDTIPAALARLPNLEKFYLNDNNLSGCFPESFAVFRNWQVQTESSNPNGYDFTNNPKLPWRGAIAFTGTGIANQISAICDDSLATTQSDMIDENCNCRGVGCMDKMTTQQETICNGETYFFNGELLSESGIYTQRLSTLIGSCDSTIELQLTVLPPSAGLLKETICQGDALTLNGETYGASGTYLQRLTNDSGCDSLLELQLSVTSSVTHQIERTICLGDSLVLNGETYRETGSYTQNFKSANGCDSLLELQLSFFPPAISQIDQTICQEDSLVLNGKVYKESGTFFQNFVGTNGCDSMVELRLTTFPAAVSQVERTVCRGDSVVINKEVFKKSGTFFQTLTNQNNCDSLVELTIAVIESSSTQLDASPCAGEPYFFNNQLLTTSGVYSETLTNSLGCDSIITVILSFQESLSTTLPEQTICAGNTYDFYNQSLNTTGLYETILSSSTGCDSLLRQPLTVNFPDTTELEELSFCTGTTLSIGGLDIVMPGLYTYLDTVNTSNECGIIRSFLVEETEVPTLLKAYADTILYPSLGKEQIVEILRNDTFPPYSKLQIRLIEPSISETLILQQGRFLYFNSDANLLRDSFKYELCTENVCQICDTATVTILIENTCQNQALALLPTAFSPNSDLSENRIFDPMAAFEEADCFFPDGTTQLTIQNRWGEVVFYANPYQPWDGSNPKTGVPFTPNAFYYIFQYGTENEKAQRVRGIINLIELE
ncbi:MAG: hypothetical protein AAGJ18_00870 [Bacteroidota bacterium]